MKLRRRIKIFTVILMAVVILFGGVIVHRKEAAASTPIREKVYTSVKLQDGDSLWDLAEVYCESSSNTKLHSYVDELMEINHIVNDRALQPGSYITVFYYK